METIEKNTGEEMTTRKYFAAIATLLTILAGLLLVVLMVLCRTNVVSKEVAFSIWKGTGIAMIPIAVVGLIADYKRSLRQLAKYGLIFLAMLIPHAAKTVFKEMDRLDEDKSF